MFVFLAFFLLQYVVSLDQGKFASLTIKGVSMEDSGRYTMIVQNKYGGESVDIVVSFSAVHSKWLELFKDMTFLLPSVTILMPECYIYIAFIRLCLKAVM